MITPWAKRDLLPDNDTGLCSYYHVLSASKAHQALISTGSKADGFKIDQFTLYNFEVKNAQMFNSF